MLLVYSCCRCIIKRRNCNNNDSNNQYYNKYHNPTNNRLITLVFVSI